MSTQGDAVSIIGAGLAGSMLAAALSQRGHPTTVYERRPDSRVVNLDAGRSINLALANRGLHALQRIGLGEQVEQLITPMRGRMLHDPDGKLQFQSYGQREEEVIFSISRPGLNQLLLDQAEYDGANILFQQRCTDVDFGAPTLHMQDTVTEQNYTLSGRPVFAADGSGSSLRRAMESQGLTHATEDYLGHGYKELSIPAKHDGDYQMEPHALHIWPRGDYMLIALPNLDCSFTVTLFMPNHGPISFDSLTEKPLVMDFFQEVFPDVVPLIPNLADEFFANPTGFMVTVRAAPWRSGSGVLLIGDAAHAIVPFHGQGMNCAFEDCRKLTELLDANPSKQWHEVFAEFESIRKTNTDALAELALENYVEMRDTVRDPRFQLKKKLAWALEKAFPDLFIPRYSMVMFHNIPYAEAQQRGLVQTQILEQLADTTNSPDNLNYELAAELIEKDLVPLVRTPLD